MQYREKELKKNENRQGSAAGAACGHLLVLAAAVLAIFSGTYLFNLTPEKLREIGAMRESLIHIRICAFCVIFLGMTMLLSDLLDWHERKTARKGLDEDGEEL